MRTLAARILPAVATLALAASVTACSATDAPASPTVAATAGTAVEETTLTVYAAASLREPFTTIAADFEAEHPGTTVQLQFAGSADLLTQLEGGAPADVLATADTPTMDKAVAAALIDGEPTTFATNQLVIAVEPGNPLGIAGLPDLTAPDVLLVVCAPQVPCGAATERATQAAGLTLSPVAETSSVTDVMTAVTSGEADAGLVYVTDVAASGGAAQAVEFPESDQAVNAYPISTVAGTENPEGAASFVEYVTGPGAAVLADAGFGAP